MSEATCRRNFMEIWSACKCDSKMTFNIRDRSRIILPGGGGGGGGGGGVLCQLLSDSDKLFCLPPKQCVEYYHNGVGVS